MTPEKLTRSILKSLIPLCSPKDYEGLVEEMTMFINKYFIPRPPKSYVEVLKELIDLIEDNNYEFDSFSLQPAKKFLKEIESND